MCSVVIKGRSSVVNSMHSIHNKLAITQLFTRVVIVYYYSFITVFKLPKLDVIVNNVKKC